ncbi:hypothetical protein [Paenibacillus macerans]|uniref:hypothetical protein n=1 Tax=Paenibacillus macerans TaxID=44252 RepID=UPI002041ABDF|nr:hypothetical protein [Paenibacillus macerans]MCM3699700.1 hypothetical protein [Paenibacillus macerans]
MAKDHLMRHRWKSTIMFQMIMGFSVILLAIIFMISFFSYRYSSDVVLEKSTDYLLESVIQMSEKLDTMLGEYDRLSLRIAFNSATQSYLKSSYSETTSHRPGVYALEKVITHEQGYLPNDLFIDMMDNQGDFIFSLPAESGNIVQKEWFQKVLSIKARCFGQ